jgi:large subunit ribosomal protein L29
MKAEELRTLDADELGGRLRGARRELYELRFKLAVGQQDNHREIRKARKEIARILTVVHQRRLEAVDEGDFEQRLAGSQPEGEEAVETAGSATAATAEGRVDETETASGVGAADEPATEEAEAAPAAEETNTEEGPVTDADKAPTRRRGRKASSEDEEA